MQPLEKPLIDLKQRPLQYIANEAYFSITKNLPVLKDLPDNDSAYISGGIAGAAIALLGAYLTKPSSAFIKTCVTATIASDVLPKVIMPEKEKQWRDENPRYSHGVDGVRDGAVLAGLFVLAIHALFPGQESYRKAEHEQKIR